MKSFTRESNARDFYNAYKFAFVGDLARAFPPILGSVLLVARD